MARASSLFFHHFHNRLPMGLIELFKHYKNVDMDKRNLLDNILTSANELDVIVKEISEKTEEIRLHKTMGN